MQSGCNAARNASESCLLDQVGFGWTAHNRKSAGATAFAPTVEQAVNENG